MKYTFIAFSTILFLLGRMGGTTLTLASEPPAVAPLEVSAPQPAEPVVAQPHVIDGTELTRMLGDVLQQDPASASGELELKLGRPWSPISTADESNELRIVEMPTMGLASDFIVRFEILNHEQRVGTWQMPVTARVWREVWIARSSLRRGQLFVEADCVRARRDILLLREAYLGDGADDATLEFAENVSAGSPILQRHLKPRTLVRRGQVAEAVARDGGMSISLRVEVLEDGGLGQQIRVRNPQSKREFRGKVESEGTVAVSL